MMSARPEVNEKLRAATGSQARAGPRAVETHPHRTSSPDETQYHLAKSLTADLTSAAGRLIVQKGTAHYRQERVQLCRYRRAKSWPRGFWMARRNTTTR